MFYKRTKRKGFTLIELLVVVAIISLLSSIIVSNITTARMKARDARRIQDFRQLSTALELYFNKYGTYPNEGANIPSNPWINNYNNMAQQLVSEGFISKIPVSPYFTDVDFRYHYYNYGPGTAAGALIVTQLETVPSSTTGVSPSCRPFAPLTNWCGTDANSDYCFCHPY